MINMLFEIYDPKFMRKKIRHAPGEYYYFRVYDDKIEFRGMTPDNVLGFIIQLHNSDRWEVQQSAEDKYIVKKDKLDSVLKRFQDDTLVVSSDGDVLTVSKDSTNNVTMPLSEIAMSEVADNLDISDIEGTKYKTKELKEAVDLIVDFDYSTVTLNQDDELRLEAKGNINKANSVHQSVDIKGGKKKNASVEVNPDYLKDALKSFGANLWMDIQENYPLRLKYSTGNRTVMYFIAPYIENM